MFCRQCGTQLQEDSQFCGKCGGNQNQSFGQQQPDYNQHPNSYSQPNQNQYNYSHPNPNSTGAPVSFSYVCG